MRRESKKAAKIRRETDPARKAYVEEVGRCQFPNCSYAAAECHEILRGSAYRYKALYHRATWLGLCRTHHERMGDYSAWPIERQLALKLLVDPEYFDLAKILEIRGNCPNEFTMTGIVHFLRIRERFIYG